MSYRQFISGKHLNLTQYSKQFNNNQNYNDKQQNRQFNKKKTLNISTDYMNSSKRINFLNTTHQLFIHQKYNHNNLKNNTSSNKQSDIIHCLNGRTLFRENNNITDYDFQLKGNLSKELLNFNSNCVNNKDINLPAKSQRYNLTQKKNWRVLKETSSTDSKQAGSSLIFDKYDKLDKLQKVQKLDKFNNIDKFDKIDIPSSTYSSIRMSPSQTQTTQGKFKSKKKSSFQMHLQKKLAEHKKNLLLLKNFRIIQKIGQGKSGKVFKCIDKVTGAIMAMKVINKQDIKRTKMLEQLIRQLKIQAILNHPNIAKLYGFFHDRDNFYILTQLGCDGQLYNLMKPNIPIPQQQVSYTINSLLRALQYMHNQKLLHRDIKPQNIVLAHGCIKLCDFGWAVSNDNDLRSTICGTPLYLSPQLINQRPYDQKVDIWAVGVLAFQMATGKTPFNITNRSQLLKIVTSQIEFPKDLQLSPQFKTFVNQILQKDPKKRLSCKQLKKLPFIRKYQEYDNSQLIISGK